MNKDLNYMAIPGMPAPYNFRIVGLHDESWNYYDGVMSFPQGFHTTQAAAEKAEEIYLQMPVALRDSYVIKIITNSDYKPESAFDEYQRTGRMRGFKEASNC